VRLRGHGLPAPAPRSPAACEGPDAVRPKGGALCYTPRVLENDLEDRIARLSRLAEADEGLFVIALHSFIEAYIRDDAPALKDNEDFADLVWAYRERLATKGATAEDLSLLSRIIREHSIVRLVTQSFMKLDREEARAAAHNFLRFCAMCGIESGQLHGLESVVKAWEEKLPRTQAGGELARIQAELLHAQGDGRKLLSQTAQWARDKQRLAELDGETMRLSLERQREKERPDGNRGSVERIERELTALTAQKRALAQALEAYKDLDAYVQQMGRFSQYTRTRMDYERSVMRLTAEQQEAVDALRPGHDLLVRGGAGTGKTIVLLHALRQAVRAREGELSLDPGSRILFLTYTTTLVKYDRYIAGLLREREAEGLILTVDSFFQSRLAALGEHYRVDYGLAARLAEKLNTTGFLSAQELAVEVEEFLFGSLVTRREYVEERIPRRGMRQPLSAGQREEVWGIRDRFVEEMEAGGTLSKNYSRMRLIAHLAEHPADERLRDLDVAFVDEAQDLSAADLRALKLMSRRGLALAGDTGQSIYGAGSPYKRAGIDVSGRSRVLHMSFRNTLPIQSLAESYRSLSGLEEDEGGATVAFREGPVPELYTAANREELGRLLLRKAALFIENLGYDPENITVLAPTKTDLATIGDALGHAGYRHANIHDDDFSFKQEKTIRLSTLHSSKGLDFPVVLLYLPRLPARLDYDDKAADTLMRNLIYVAMTRAMDNLNVFTLEGAHESQRDEPLQDLVRVFRDRHARI
jgi:hypothetical protein